MNKKKVLMIVLFILFWIGVGTSIFWLLRKSKNVLPSLTYGVVERNNQHLKIGYVDLSPFGNGNTIVYIEQLDDEIHSEEADTSE